MFGKVLHGLEVLRAIEAVPTNNDIPKWRVAVAACGELSEEEYQAALSGLAPEPEARLAPTMTLSGKPYGPATGAGGPAGMAAGLGSSGAGPSGPSSTSGSSGSSGTKPKMDLGGGPVPAGEGVAGSMSDLLGGWQPSEQDLAQIASRLAAEGFRSNEPPPRSS